MNTMRRLFAPFVFSAAAQRAALAACLLIAAAAPSAYAALRDKPLRVVTGFAAGGPLLQANGPRLALAVIDLLVVRLCFHAGTLPGLISGVLHFRFERANPQQFWSRALFNSRYKIRLMLVMMFF